MGSWFSQPYAEACEMDPTPIFQYFGDDYYKAGLEHWSAQEDTVGGMLDGFVNTDEPDLTFSEQILRDYAKSHRLQLNRAADVACGIGRVSIGMLGKFFKHISLVEPVPKFLTRAETSLREMGIDVTSHCCGAQSWSITESFDCFWLQWVFLFLTDDDSVLLLKKCRLHLSKSGIVVVKENVVLSESRAETIWWPKDHSLTRSRGHLRQLFRAAGLRVALEEKQPNWPADLVPLLIFVLLPE
jgi:protein N-terminal methyltransferase